MSDADHKEYFRAYYFAHKETMLRKAKVYAKKNRAQINANRRYRYRHDAAYRMRDLERHRLKRERMKKDAA